jgi:repressor LexA
MSTINKTLRIFEFIKRYSRRNGFAPTFKEIGQVFEMESSATVHAHLKKMEARNWIKRSRRWRGIEIVEEQTKAA